MKVPSLILSIALLSMSACGGGGGGSDGPTPDNNACELIGLNPKIIDGTACANPETSAVVRIILQNTDGTTGQCSGTMLTQDVVLTAAHCFLKNPSATYISIGDPGSERVLPAIDIVTHPLFGQISEKEFARDVALVKLSENSNLPTLPIQLSTAVAKDSIVSIFGYGIDNSGDISNSLRSGEMKVSHVSTETIQANFNDDGSNTCNGDSGGPLVDASNGTALIGVVSSGTKLDCKKGDQSFFTNLQDPLVSSFIVDLVPGVQTK